MHNYLKRKRVLIGITGGIAAYKILELIRRLKEQDCVVKVVLTENAKSFVTPLSIQALGGDLEVETAMSHIELARWAEVMLVAPASANFIAKFAHGLADDLLSTLCLATTAPIIIAPAMNQQMWSHPATQKNIQILAQRDFAIIGPAHGSQACGEFGPGRMLEAHELLATLEEHFAPKIFSGQHILITAGPTQENLDPVRYLSNHSSGKMGYALAHAALKLGASVTLISGPSTQNPPSSKNLQLIPIISADQTHQAVMQRFDNNQIKIDIFIGCAAVVDYKAASPKSHKIKKNAESLIIELVPTVDILSAVARLPEDKRPFTVGFAAETEDLEANAVKKLQIKGADLIIANPVGYGRGFNSDENQVSIYSRQAAPKHLAKMCKASVADMVLREIHEISTVALDVTLDA